MKFVSFVKKYLAAASVSLAAGVPLSVDAALIDYEFIGKVESSSSTYPDQSYFVQALVDTSLERIVSFTFTVGGDKTWAGTGGTAEYDPNADVATGDGVGAFALLVADRDGVTWSTIADGFTPSSIAELSVIFGNPTNGGATALVGGYPTAFDLSFSGSDPSFWLYDGSTGFGGDLTSARGTVEMPEAAPITLMFLGFAIITLFAKRRATVMFGRR